MGEEGARMAQTTVCVQRSRRAGVQGSSANVGSRARPMWEAAASGVLIGRMQSVLAWPASNAREEW